MARASKTKAAKSEATTPQAPEPPSTSGGDSETTGRFIVVFKDKAVGDPAAVKSILRNVAGISELAVAC
jgi:hypothetical protein